MKTKNTLALTFAQAKGRYGDLLGGTLVLIAIRLIALCPLLTLLYKGDSLLSYGWVLTPVLYLLWVLPLRFSMAEAMNDFLAGGRFCTGKLLSFNRYGRKLGLVVKHAVILLLWALPFIAALGYVGYTVFGSGTDVFTLIRKIMQVGALVGGTTIEGVLLIAVALIVSALPLLYGICRLSSQRHLWAANVTGKVLRGGRWAQLGWGLVSLLLLLPFIGVLGYLAFDLVKVFISTFKVPALTPVLWKVGLAALVLYLPLIPLRRLLTACFTLNRAQKGAWRSHAA